MQVGRVIFRGWLDGISGVSGGPYATCVPNPISVLSTHFSVVQIENSLEGVEDDKAPGVVPVAVPPKDKLPIVGEAVITAVTV